jgi:HEAT repeat protein
VSLPATADLITSFLERRASSADTAEQLLERGDELLSEILARAEHEMIPAHPALLAILSSAATPRTFDRLVAALEDPDYAVSYSAFLALGHLGDRRAAPILAQRLIADGGSATAVPCATALIQLGDHTVAPLLRRKISEWGDKGAIDVLVTQAQRRGAAELTWALMIAAALAAYGDQSGAPVAFQLAGLPRNILRTIQDGVDLHSSFCLELRHFAAPGLYAVVRAAMEAGPECAEILTRVLAFVGTREALKLLVQLAGSENTQTSAAAAYWLDTVAHAQLKSDQKRNYGGSAVRWWRKHEESLPEGQCFYNGEPWRPETLFDRLDSVYDSGDEHLLMVLGIRINQEAKRRGKSRLQAIAVLREEAATSFERGALYRYGAPIDLNTL